MTTEVDVIGSDGDVAALLPEWRELAVAAGASPFLQPDVALAWWRHLGRGSLRVVTVRDGRGRLDAVTPLHERRLGPLAVLRWLGFGLGAVGEVLVRPGAPEGTAARGWDALSGDRRRVLHLVECRHGGAGVDDLRRHDAWQSQTVLRDACPVIDVRSHDSVASFLAEPGRRKLRQNLARYDRAAERAGTPVTVDVHVEPAGMRAALDDLTLVHDRAEAHQPRLHFLAHPYRSFTVDALDAAAGQGGAAAFVLRAGGRPVGLHLALRAGTTAYAWVARVDPIAADLGPGHLLLRSVVDWAIGAGCDTVDLQLGDDPYKLRWSTSAYDTLGLVAAAPGRLGAARAALAGLDGAHRARATAAVRLGQRRSRTRSSD